MSHERFDWSFNGHLSADCKRKPARSGFGGLDYSAVAQRIRRMNSRDQRRAKLLRKCQKVQIARTDRSSFGAGRAFSCLWMSDCDTLGQMFVFNRRSLAVSFSRLANEFLFRLLICSGSWRHYRDFRCISGPHNEMLRD